MKKMISTKTNIKQLHWLIASVLFFAGLAFTSSSQALLISSTDVPKAINDGSTITSTLIGPDLLISDINLQFSSLTHTCIADLHIELTAPSGTNSLIIESFPNNGILTSLGCPNDFLNTVLDDDAATNLVPVAAPWTGSFNVAHPSVGTNPLSIFDGEIATGVWTLLVRDDAGGDTGSLNGWGIDFTGSPVSVPVPATLALLGLGLAGLGWSRRKKM